MHLALRVTIHGNYFPAATGISKHYFLRTIVSERQVDFNKELVFSFGDYIQASQEMPHKNKKLPRSLDCIYLRAKDLCKEGTK